MSAVTIDKVQLKLAIGNIISIAYTKNNGFSASAGWLKGKATIEIDSFGIGTIHVGNLRGIFHVKDRKMQELGGALELGEEEILGTRLEIYPDEHGDIEVEGEVKRSIGKAIVLSGDLGLRFNTVDIIKLIPGMPRAINALDGKLQDIHNMGYIDCITGTPLSDPQCKQLNGLH
jgi:hypothetical protein